MAVAQCQGERNAWYTSDLVVVLEHRAEVLNVLERWGVRFDTPTDADKNRYESQDLGLALIPLTDNGETAAERTEKAAASAVAGLRREAVEEPAVAAWLKKAEGNAGAYETADAAIDAHLKSVRPGMDQILWALRTHFAARYEGWMPTLGKNRVGGDVEGGNGQISHGLRTPPAPADWRPEPALRPKKPGLGVRVGVLDTSISPHPWLADSLVCTAGDFLEPQDEYPAEAGHGTFVAGLILQRAPGCVIEYRRVLSDGGTATSWDVANKMVELGRTGLDVLNLSLGCYTEDGQPPFVLATAIDRLDPDIVVVAAAGNHGDVQEKAGDAEHPPVTAGDQRKPSWPAALDDVVAVGAGDDQRHRAPFTPDDVLWIDVHSNGVEVSSTYLYGEVDLTDMGEKHESKTFKGYAKWSGTSFSAALVSGEIAARTVPGERSARQAWRSILDELKEEQPRVRPPFLWLV